MAWGGEAAPVGADLGQDHLGGGPADAADLIPPVHRRRERGDQLLELAVQLGDVGVRRSYPGQQLGQQEPVMVGAVAGERLLQDAARGPHAAPVPAARAAWGVLARDQRRQQLAARDPQAVAGTTDSLIWASTRQPARPAASPRSAPPPDPPGSGSRLAAAGSAVGGRSWAAASAARRACTARPHPACRSWAVPGGA
jgi:hypothetical protein